MTRDSNSRPTGRDVKQARGEARQSGGAAASPERRANRPGDTIGEGEMPFAGTTFETRAERTARDARSFDDAYDRLCEAVADYRRTRATVRASDLRIVLTALVHRK